MLYTDGSHLVAESLQELYQYANKVGLNTEWIDFMGRNLHPHFDICGHVKARVLQDENVKQISTKELVQLLKLNYRLPETEVELNEWEAHHKTTLNKLELPSATDYKRMLDGIFKRSGIKFDT